MSRTNQLPRDFCPSDEPCLAYLENYQALNKQKMPQGIPGSGFFSFACFLARKPPRSRLAESAGFDHQGIYIIVGISTTQFSRPANAISSYYGGGGAFTGACERDSVAWTVNKSVRVRGLYQPPSAPSMTSPLLKRLFEKKK